MIGDKNKNLKTFQKDLIYNTYIKKKDPSTEDMWGISDHNMKTLDV